MKKNTNKTEKGGRKKKISKVLLYLLVLLALYCVIYLVPKVTGLFTSTYVAQYGEIKTVDKTDGWIVRDEKVYVTPSGGTANKLIKDGQLIRKGTKIVEVSGDAKGSSSESISTVLERLGSNVAKTDSYTAEDGGIVSFYVDGYENKLNFDTMKKKKKDFFDNVNQDSVVELKDKKMAAGDPVYRIIDKAKWYLVVYIKPGHMDRYKKDEDVSVIIDGKDEDAVDMTVYSVEKEGSEAKLILESNVYFPGFSNLRKAPVEIVTSNAKGLIIDTSSLTKKKGVEGVYIKDKQGKAVFVPVQVLAKNGDKAAITDSYFHDDDGNKIETVNPYDDVLKRPE